MNKKIELKNLIFYTFLLIYGILIIYLASKVDIWEDEAYSLHTTSKGLLKVIERSYTFEGQAPFYFLTLAIWRHINSGIFFARLLSVLFLGLSAVYFYKLINLINGKDFSRWMVIIYLLNPFSVWAALEIRLYSMVIFLSCILTYSFFRFFFENKKKFLYIFLVTCLVGLFTQYFIALEIAALGITLLIFKGIKKFLNFCLYCIPLVVLFIPNLFFLSHQIGITQDGSTRFHQVDMVIHSPQVVALGLLETISVNIWVNRLSRLLIVACLVLAYYKLYRKQNPSSKQTIKNINFFVVNIVAVFFLYLSLVVILNFSFQARYMALALPFFIFLYSIFKVYNPITTKTIFLAILCLYVYELYINYDLTPVRTFDYKSASKIIHKIEKPHEPILLFKKSLIPAFSFYYRGPDSLYSLPRFRYDGKDIFATIEDTTSLKEAIKEIHSPTGTYILMNNSIEGFINPINMNARMFDKCLQSNYNITFDTILPGNKPEHFLRIRRLIEKNN